MASGILTALFVLSIVGGGLFLVGLIHEFACLMSGDSDDTFVMRLVNNARDKRDRSLSEKYSVDQRMAMLIKQIFSKYSCPEIIFMKRGDIIEEGMKVINVERASLHWSWRDDPLLKYCKEYYPSVIFRQDNEYYRADLFKITDDFLDGDKLKFRHSAEGFNIKKISASEVADDLRTLSAMETTLEKKLQLNQERELESEKYIRDFVRSRAGLSSGDREAELLNRLGITDVMWDNAKQNWVPKELSA